MNWTHTIEGFIRVNEATVVFILSALTLCLVFSNTYLLAKVGKLARTGRRATERTQDSATPDIDDWTRRLDGSDERIAALSSAHQDTVASLMHGIQRVALVRFDAFPDVGGEQSFALALLDRDMTGVIISNLLSRADSRVYAKEIVQGKSQHTLSDEEREALRRAGELER